jgi:hypothetical protein
MSNIVFTPKWNSAINQVEVYEPITGGANGNANLAPKQLAENVFYLKNEISTLSVEINDTNKKLDAGLQATHDYADTKKTEAINSAKSYTDFQDTINLNSAKSYADTKKTEAITTSNSYTDSQDTINLNSAKSYADTKKTEAINSSKSYTDSQDVINLNSAKSYADTKKTEAITTSNSYADTKKTEAIAVSKDYADIADNTVEQYAREQDVINLNSAKSYADTKKTEAITAANSYSDTKKTEAIASANTYTDQKQTISSYNPVFSSLTGVASITGSNITYIRTDKMVKIFGTLTVNIATAGNFSFKMSLPITSNFINENQAGGSFLSEDSISGYIKSGNDKLLTFVSNAKSSGSTIVAGINIIYVIV